MNENKVIAYILITEKLFKKLIQLNEEENDRVPLIQVQYISHLNKYVFMDQDLFTKNSKFKQISRK